MPVFSASCPFITSVALQSVLAPKKPLISRVVGGGFSNVFARPSYQDAIVRRYIDQFTTNLSMTAFNHSGRAYPDVSANGYVPEHLASEANAYPILPISRHNYQVFIDQQLSSVFGTSASTPTWAAMITAVNFKSSGYKIQESAVFGDFHCMSNTANKR